MVPPTTSDLIALLTVKAEGSDLPDTWRDALVEARVRRALGTIGRCTLRFVDDKLELGSSAKLKIGTEIAVTAHVKGKATVVFEGTVTAVGMRALAGGVAELEVVAEDGASRLRSRSTAGTYLNVKASEMIAKVAGEASLNSDVTSTSTQFPYTLQADTDLAFLDDLCRNSGLVWVVRGRTLHAFPAAGAEASGVTLTWGENLLEFTAKTFGDAPDSVTVRGWDHLKKEPIVGMGELKPAVATTSMANLRPSGGGSASALSTRYQPVDKTDADTLAAVGAAATGTVQIRGRCYFVTLDPGTTVKIASAGPADGTYLLREVEHVFRPDRDLEVSFVGGDRPAPSLAGPPPARSSFVHDGLVVGVVTAIDDDPGNAGRIRVSLPALGDQVESHWARLAVLGGGEKRGMVFVPEVGDEVLVGFENGDVRRPVVLGGLFGEKAAIPTGLVKGGKVTGRSLTSRLGHVIELADGDEPSKQFVRLALAGGEARLRIGKDEADLTLPAGAPLTIKVGPSTITLDGNGAITLDGTTITLKGSESVSIEGTNVTLKAQSTLDASGTQVEIKGQATTTVQASGITAVKGGMVQIN